MVNENDEEHVKKHKLHQVEDMYKFPYSPHGQLVAKFKNRYQYGSGVLIDRQFVLTTAYNVYSRTLKEYPQEVIFLLMQGGVKTKVTSVAFSSNFKSTESDDEAKSDCVAIIRLDEPVDELGCLGLKVKETYIDTEGFLVGYPYWPFSFTVSHKDSGIPYTSSGKIEKIGERFIYKMDTLAGMSGASILIKEDDEYYIVGLHTHNGKNNMNSGIAINRKMFFQIEEWMKELDISLEKDPQEELTNNYLIKKFDQILSVLPKIEVSADNTQAPSILFEGASTLQEEVKKETITTLSPYFKPKEISDSHEEAEAGEVYLPATLLSIDGGGIRGYMPAIWLDYVSEKTGREIHQLFDFIGGTSTGGILALGLAAPKEAEISTSSLVKLFKEEAGYIFPKKSKWIPNFMYNGISYAQHKYSEKPLEALLERHFGLAKLEEVQTRVVVTSVLADTHIPFLFKSYDEAVKPCQLWQVARAISAAPSYFRSYSLKLPHEETPKFFIDGGIYRNNPVEDMITEAFKYSRSQGKELSHKNIHVISLGTGQVPIKLVPHQVGQIESAVSVIEALMNSNSMGAHEAVRSVLLEEQYLRINPNLKRNIELDDISPDNMAYIEKVAKEQFSAIDESIDEGQIRKILEAENHRFFDK